MKRGGDERVDINLDNEPIAESAKELMDQALKSAPEAEQETSAAQAAATPAHAEELPAPDVKAVAEHLAKLQAEKDELFQTLIRRQADFDNYRKRVERERQQDSARATGYVMEQLLPVLDAFERALAAAETESNDDHRKGVELIYRQLWDVLARQGLERIEAKGKPFDPYVHQALERIESMDCEDGTVVEELQPGYKFRDKVLRPTMVRVAVHPVPEDPASSENPPEAS